MATDQESAATVGLLPYLSSHALDDDYQAVAQRAGDDGASATPASSRGAVWTVVVLALFVVLLITAASQTSKNAVADESERKDLIAQINARKGAVSADTDHINQLRTQVASLRAQLFDNDKLSAGTRDQLQLLSVRSGVAAVHGPGVTVTVDDAPSANSARETVLDTDLQQLVNGLWQAGAEAIAINGQRLTALSPIRQAGSAIAVNFIGLERPYVVRAIGDPTTLPARFADTDSGQAWLDLHERVGLKFAMRTRTNLSLPAAATPTLREAQQPLTRAEVKEGTS